MDNAFRKIFLIGMMGSGKSFWAGRIGNYYGLTALDLDRLIEQEACKSVREIFAQDGEDFFRTKESEILRNGIYAKQFIVATGGGTPCFNDNMLYMKQNGLVIWMNPPIDELLARVSRSLDTRPVLKGIKSPEALKAHLLALMNKRIGWYQQADVVISDDSSLEKIVEKINDFEKTKP